MAELLSRVLTALFLSIALASPCRAGVLTIAQDGSGSYRSIQAAVDKAKPYDTLLILDGGEYREQVTLRAPLHNISLIARDPGKAGKPVIRWRDTEHVGPRNCEEALTDSAVDYDKNGALRLLNVRDVTVEGIAIDGDSTFVTAWEKVWPYTPGTCLTGMWPQFSGNAALVMFHCANIRIRECSLAHAFYGALIKERDGLAPFREKASTFEPRRGLRMVLGNHSFTGNVFRENTWGVFVDAGWGLGSTFRDNLFWRNRHADTAAAQQTYTLPGGKNLTGGAFSFKNTRQSTMAIVNNTFAGNFLLFAGQDNAGAEHLVANNVLGRPEPYWEAPEAGPFESPFQDLSQVLTHRMKFNLFAGQMRPPKPDSIPVERDWIDTATGKSHVAKGFYYFFGMYTIMNGLPHPADNVAPESVQVTDGQTTRYAQVTPVGTNPGNFLSDQYSAFTAADGNRWVETEFVSRDPSVAGFLRPVDSSLAWFQAGWPALGYRTRSGKDAGVGAVAAADRVSELRVTPLLPALAAGDTLALRFMLSAPESPGSGPGAPRVKYCRLIRKLPADLNAFGASDHLVLTEAEPLPLEGASLHYGYNELRIPWPAPARDSVLNGFVEMAVEGDGAFSNIAQFPVLPDRPLLKVEVLDDGPTLRIRVSTLDSSALQAPLFLGTASGAALTVLEASDTARDSTGAYDGPLPLTFRIGLSEASASGTEMILVSAPIARADGVYGSTPPFVVPREPTSAKRPVNKVVGKASAEARPSRDGLGRALRPEFRNGVRNGFRNGVRVYFRPDMRGGSGVDAAK